MEDGRYYVKYWWGAWGIVHQEHFDNVEELQKFLSKIVKKTDWS